MAAHLSTHLWLVMIAVLLIGVALASIWTPKPGLIRRPA